MKARVKIPGSHNLNSLLFSIAVCNQIDIPFNKIKKSLSKIDVSVTRYKEYHTEDFDIFDDSYNSALESIKSDIHMLKKHKKNLCVVFGDILETGEKTRYINKSLAYFLAEENIKQYYLYGNNAEYISKLLTKKGVDPKQVFVNSKVEDPQITLDQIKRNHIKGSTILLKSSHNEPLNFIIDYFVKQNITRKK